MNTILLRCFLLALLLMPTTVRASEDSLAVPLSFQTIFDLPSPWRSGAIVAEAKHDQKEAFTRFTSLAIKLGTETIEVPKKVLEFFPGPRLSTLEVWVGSYADTPSTQPNRYINVTFRFGGHSYLGIYSTEPGMIGQILIHGGQIRSVSKGTGEYGAMPRFIDFDPITLKEIKYESSRDKK